MLHIAALKLNNYYDYEDNDDVDDDDGVLSKLALRRNTHHLSQCSLCTVA